jgi:hypothetical protein
MGKVLLFRTREQKEPLEKDLSERIEQIKGSINRINELILELKNMKHQEYKGDIYE